jgi:mRNA-degrading endonuclease RelE of RelBE toxin-antitoxin system
MRLLYTERFRRSYEAAPPHIQRAFQKQTRFLLHNLRHPSLRTKKYDKNRWQARVDGGWRFYFRIEADTYILLDLIPHPK